MATVETHQATDEPDTPGWTAEVELRSSVRSRFHEDDRMHRPYPAKPDPARAEHFDPDGIHADYCHNDALREIEEIVVYDDRIVVPLDTCRRVDDTAQEGEVDDFSRLMWRIMDKMRIMETEPSRGTTRFNLGLWDHTNTTHTYTTDYRKTDPRPIYARLPKDHRKNELQKLYERRRRNGRTLLGIIIARDAATGTGKTTLACQLAKDWDTHGWTADRATLDPGTYADKYTDENTPKKSVLILDEGEQAADNRRSMSSQNVKLSHLWATMRFREIYSIVTLPSASMLDKRLKELADVKIVVHNRGTAVAYKTKIDDHSGEYRAKRLCRLRWDDLDDDPEYQRLTQKKADRMENYADSFSYGDDDADDDTPDPKNVRRDYRNDVLQDAYERTDLTQQQLANVFDLSRSAVSKIISAD